MGTVTRTVAALAAVALTLAALGTLGTLATSRETVRVTAEKAEVATGVCNIALNEQCRLDYILDALATATGSTADMVGSLPNAVPQPALSDAKFACTPDGVSPKSAGPSVLFIACCPGSAPVNITQTDALCKPTTPDKLLECVSTDFVPTSNRCDLTSSLGETSCPLSAMTPSERYLIYPGGLTSCYHQPTATGYGACAGTAHSVCGDALCLRLPAHAP
jgi:hypothetical protein